MSRVPEEPLTHPPDYILTAIVVGDLGVADAATQAAALAHAIDCPICALKLDPVVDTFTRSIRAAARKAPPIDPTSGEQEDDDETIEWPKISGYNFLSRIGKGGTGVVYAAQTSDGRIVAVKVLRPRWMADTAVVRRFRREKEFAGMLVHPNIVQILQSGEENGHHFLEAELLGGYDLAQTLRMRGRLPWMEAVGYIHQIIRGLLYASNKGLVHRDIKPQNLMVTQEGVVKILDFGLVRMICDAGTGVTVTMPTAVLGTPGYMAPEQYEAPSRCDSRSDIYGLGCTFYHILAGKAPFEADSWLKILLLQQKGYVPRLDSICDDIIPEAADVVERMIARDTSDRYQTLDELANALSLSSSLDNLISVRTSRSRIVSDPSVSLFNGEDLTGWIQEGPHTTEISVVDGVLTAKNTTRQRGYVDHLVSTRADYSDFHLQYEFFLVDDVAPASVQVRVEASLVTFGGMRGYLVAACGMGGTVQRPQEGKEKEGIQWDAGLTTLALASRARSGYALAQAMHTPMMPGEWHRIDICAVGNRIRVWINRRLEEFGPRGVGLPQIDYPDEGRTFRQGAIALVCYPGIHVKYRNFKLRPVINDLIDPQPERSRWVHQQMVGNEWNERWQIFQLVGQGVWIESVCDSDGFWQHRFGEVDRNKEYIELQREHGPNERFVVRLFSDHGEIGPKRDQLPDRREGVWLM
jgi:serine/threonine protein kinase